MQHGSLERPIAAVVYAAKSTPDEKDSTGDQVARVRAEIERVGGRVVIGEAFSEENVSAFRGSRGPKLEAAMRAAIAAAGEHGEAELWVFHSSRLARGDGRKGAARSLLKVYADLLAEGVALRSVSDDDYLRNGLLVAVASEQNHKYSADLSAHVKRGKRQQFEKGERLGGPVPDGYVLLDALDAGRAVRRYELDPVRAPVISRMFELADGGMAPANVARRLNAEGLRTKAGGLWKRRRVQDTLTNPFYAGLVARNRSVRGAVVETAPGGHPALVEATMLDRIAAQFAARDRAAGSVRDKGRPNSRHLFARLAYCTRCDSRLYAVTSTYKRKDGSRARQYVCPHYKESTGGCDQPPIDAEVVERAFLEHLQHFFIDWEAWLAARSQQQGAERSAIEQSLAVEQARLAKLNQAEPKARARWIDSLEDDALEATRAELYQSLVREREQVQHRLDELAAALAATPVEPQTDAMLDLFNELSRVVRGHIDAAGTVVELNAHLRHVLRLVEMDACDDGGVKLIAYLSPAFLATFEDVDGAAVAEFRAAPDAGELVPPLRPVLAPSPEGANTHAYRWTNPNRLALAASQP